MCNEVYILRCDTLLFKGEKKKKKITAILMAMLFVFSTFAFAATEK